MKIIASPLGRQRRSSFKAMMDATTSMRWRIGGSLCLLLSITGAFILRSPSNGADFALLLSPGSGQEGEVGEERKVNNTIKEGGEETPDSTSTSTTTSTTNKPLQQPQRAPRELYIPPAVVAHHIIYNDRKSTAVNYSDVLPITSVNHTDEFLGDLDRAFDPDVSHSNATMMCLEWHINGDAWWTHHPTWKAGAENDTHYCFRRIPRHSYEANLLQELYQIQFHGNCSQSRTKRFWNSGWKASFVNIVDGLKHALVTNKPCMMGENRWHYADPSVKPTKDNRQVPPACPRRNMFCYFLSTSSCQPVYPGDKFWKQHKQTYAENTFLYHYATRRQTWLRKRVYDWKQQQERFMNIHHNKPCAVMHVRRGDALLDTNRRKRQYHPIAEYLNATNGKIHPNILLFTDDQNAIIEAKTEHPDYKWMYLDRPRYRANEGGWEKHVPSNNPEFEVTALLATFELAADHCSQLVVASSGFASQIRQEMNSSTRVWNMDEGKQRSEIYNTEFKHTVNVSAKYSNVNLETLPSGQEQ